MSLPICPRCGSSAVTWQHPRVPHGSDGCQACGFIGPVREFHEAKPLIPLVRGIKAAAPDPIVSPIPTRRRKPKHEPAPAPLVQKDYWYLRD